MIYIALLVIGVTCLYLYKVLKFSAEGGIAKNSIDAYIEEDVDVCNKSAPPIRGHNKYTRDYSTEGRQLLILYGTEYGFSEEVAQHLYDRIESLSNNSSVYGSLPLQPRIVNMKHHTIIDLSREQVCLIVVSTSGDGVPPTGARQFYEYIHATEHDLSHLEFSVLALGDTNYPHYCKAGRLLHNRLSDLGCTCIVDRHEVDMEDWSVIDQWLDKVDQYLCTATLHVTLDYIKHADITEDTYTRHTPFMATLVVKSLLTVCASEDDKETIHCELDISDSDLTWTSGDAVGIYPCNSPSEVAVLLTAMKCDGTVMVSKPTWAYQVDNDQDHEMMTLNTVLMKYYDLKTVKSELLDRLRGTITDDSEKVLLTFLLKEGFSKDNIPLQDYLSVREVADVLLDFQSHMLPWQLIVKCMKSLQPRYYSISSSPKTDKSRVFVTAAVLRYTSNNQPRTGVTTTYLQDRLHVGEKCPVFMSRNPDFRLPSNSNIPVILIGPGTGLAPFMAFIQERALERDCGQMLLYFGCRHEDKDYLYRRQLERWASDGIIQLAVAFSRDQEDKIYVQDLLQRDKTSIWKLLHQESASVYICGDARHMAHDVHTMLVDIVQGQGHMNLSEALTYLLNMEDRGRYQKDVWVI